MDLVSYNTEDLSSFRPNDYFFEPASRKIYQYRNKEGKAIIVREIGTTHITKLFKNTLKTVLKVEGEFDKYQVISISETSVTLFNTNIGEDFEVGFGDADNIDEIKTAFNKGDEIIAEVFDYDDIKSTMQLTIASSSLASETQQTTETTETPETTEAQVSSSELQRIKEIEEKKAKKRPFNASKPAKKPAQPVSKGEKAPVKVDTQDKKKKETPAKTSPKEKEKKIEKPSKKEEKKETKEEKKAREKREKEEMKALEKKKKEEEKAKKKKK